MSSGLLYEHKTNNNTQNSNTIIILNSLLLCENGKMRKKKLILTISWKVRFFSFINTLFNQTQTGQIMQHKTPHIM